MQRSIGDWGELKQVPTEAFPEVGARCARVGDRESCLRHTVTSHSATFPHSFAQCYAVSSLSVTIRRLQYHTAPQCTRCNCTTKYQPTTAVPQCLLCEAFLQYGECQSMLTHREIRVTDRVVRLR